MRPKFTYQRALLIAGLLLFISGQVFKIMHWPYQHVAIIAGIILIALSVMIPTGQISNNHPLQRPLAFTGIMLVALGALFKIQHWPYSNLASLMGLLLLTVSIFLPKKLLNAQ